MIVLYIFLAIIIIFALLALMKKPSSVYSNKPEEKNPMEGRMVKFVEDENEKENADGVRGHLEAIGPASHKAGDCDHPGQVTKTA